MTIIFIFKKYVLKNLNNYPSLTQTLGDNVVVSGVEAFIEKNFIPRATEYSGFEPTQKIDTWGRFLTS